MHSSPCALAGPGENLTNVDVGNDIHMSARDSPLHLCLTHASRTGSLLDSEVLDTARLLHALHLSNPAPITEPCPAMRLPASPSTSTPARARRVTHSSRGSHIRSHAQQQNLYQAPSQCQQTPAWVPDTYSLGPAPMLLAGAEYIRACMSCVWVPKVRLDLMF
jgi:hypothetical protein